MKSQHLIWSSCIAAVLAMGITSCAPQGTDNDATVTVQATLEAEHEAQNLAVIKQIYADFAAGNIDGFIAALSPDLVWNEAENNPYAPDSPYEGIEAVMGGVIAPLAAEWEYFHVEPESYMSDGNQVVMFGRYNAKYTASGKVMNPQIVHKWTLTDGKITGFQQYLDTLAATQTVTSDAE